MKSALLCIWHVPCEKLCSEKAKPENIAMFEMFRLHAIKQRKIYSLFTQFDQTTIQFTILKEYKADIFVI